MRCLPAVAAMILLLPAGIALAQPAPTPDDQPSAPLEDEVLPPATPVAPTPPPAPATEPRDDDAWTLYHQAFSALARGDDTTARTHIRTLEKSYPGHPATLRAAAIGRARWGDAPRASAEPRPDAATATATANEQAESEAPNKGSRAELALMQTFHGIALGVESCFMFACDDAGGAVALALLGGAVGTTVSLLATRGGMRPGDRALLNSGTAWGAYNGALLLFITDVSDEQQFGSLMILSQVGGLSLGAALSRRDPTAGQVALTNTFGIWSTALTLFSFRAADASFDSDGDVALLLGVTDASLLAGAVVAGMMPRVTRSQTMLIDVGGIVGGLAGMGVGVLITDDFDDTNTWRGALVGTLLGLGGATYLTQRWLAPTLAARPTLAPVAGGGLSIGVQVDL